MIKIFNVFKLQKKIYAKDFAAQNRLIVIFEFLPISCQLHFYKIKLQLTTVEHG